MVEVVLQGEGKNALSLSLMASVAEAVRAADGAPLLLRGDGDAFSAGLHLAELYALEAPQVRGFLESLTEVVDLLFRYPGPTVAAVNGHAIAGGLVLALACDARIGPAGGRARIGLNEVQLGLRFPPRILDIVRYRIPPQHQERVLLEGPLVGPEEALSLGLLDGLADDPVAAGRERLEQLSRIHRGAYGALKHDLRRHVGVADEQTDRRFLEQVLPVWTGPELKQTIHAFLNRSSR
jgi:enoyl-CoA hydratase/carnithine racemase